jgi:uncharacterized protein YsxB (DUF464 family)
MDASMTTSITLYETFTSIGIAPEQARAAVSAIAQGSMTAFEQQAKHMANKEDHALLQVEFSNQLEKLRTEMYKSHAELLKWVVTVVLATFAAIIAIYKLEI